MARISTYPLDTNLVGTDYWIGSDANSSYATKNFTIDSVAEYMNRESTQQQALRFVYTNTVPVGGGTLSFNPQGADTVAFNGITTFRLSKYDLIEPTTDISDFYGTALIGADILITQCDDVSKWAVYTWNSSTGVGAHPTFYDISLTYKNGRNGLTVNKDYFISLLTYPGTSDANFTLELSGGNQYTVTHGLNKFPSVTVFTGTEASPGNEIFCDVDFIDTTKVLLTFANTFTGVVAFN
tara:strand:- start:2733 stop:3449 length:717 start_codon:yes stop_codon:yes gene_type:complete